MSEDKLQAAKDEAAKHYGYRNFTFALIDNKKTEAVTAKAMQLYAAQCVTDERERIRNAMPSESLFISYAEVAYNHGYAKSEGGSFKWWTKNKEWVLALRTKILELIERGEG